MITSNKEGSDAPWRRRPHAIVLRHRKSYSEYCKRLASLSFFFGVFFYVKVPGDQNFGCDSSLGSPLATRTSVRTVLITCWLMIDTLTPIEIRAARRFWSIFCCCWARRSGSSILQNESLSGSWKDARLPYKSTGIARLTVRRFIPLSRRTPDARYGQRIPFAPPIQRRTISMKMGGDMENNSRRKKELTYRNLFVENPTYCWFLMSYIVTQFGE